MTTRFIRLLAEGSAAGMQPSDMTDPDAFTTDDKTELNDTFVVPRGTRCVREITETLRKFHMIAS